jgi:hypothetical protein
MVINFFKKLSVATISTAAIGFSLISINPAQAASFRSDTEQDIYTGNTIEFTFDNLNKAIGDVTLSIFATADIGGKHENINISIYSGETLTDLGNVFEGPISDWGENINEFFAEGVETLTLSESLFNSFDDVFTIQMTPNSNVNNQDSDEIASSAYIELDYVELDDVETIPEPSTVAALSLLAISGLVCNKKRHSA